MLVRVRHALKHTHSALGKSGAFTIATVSLVHLIQAWILLIYSSSNGCIAMASLLWVAKNLPDGGNRYAVSLTMMICADLALIAVFKRRMSRIVRLALMTPQQTILLIVAGFVAWCVFNQIYADGTSRSWEFILSDQIGWLGLALAHSAAIIRSANGNGLEPCPTHRSS